MKKIEVVAAVIVNDGKILATQRGYGDFKGKWEFPGGKLKADESREEGLKREILEELDVIIDVGDYITTIEYDYPEFHLTMHTFFSVITEGEIDLKEHLQLRWLGKEEMGDVDWLDADIELVECILKEM